MNKENIGISVIDRLELEVGSSLLGQIYLDLGYINRKQLNRALAFQKQKGGRLGWIMGALGYMSRLQLFEGLAINFNLEFVGDYQYLRDNIDPKLAGQISQKEIIDHQCIPFKLQGENLTVVTSNPNSQSTLDFLHLRFGIITITEVVITDLDLMKLSENLNRNTISEVSIHGLINRNPALSASTTFSKGQLVFLALFVCCLAVWFYLDHSALLLTAMFTVQFFYLGSLLFKLDASIVGLICHSKCHFSSKIEELEENELPVYSILVPVYKESKVIGSLVKALKKLDYPKNKLDIILLFEENDKETLDAAKLEKPPVTWRFLTLPHSIPQTKPKALNYGLQFSRGKYLTIYDAEDIPEPDQLKKAVMAFKNHPENYVCFQAALNYYNEKENILTKMFTIEYSGWFDCMLPGLFREKLPIPLGGTSNHFDIHKLRELGAWDPYNVTEDADLGIRASALGYKVGVIESTTYEEANSQIKNWIRQRSRWLKGFMLTSLVHNRHPLQTIKSIGLKNWLAYNLLIGGTPFTNLLNPIMWVTFIYSLFGPIDNLVNPPLLLYISMFNLVVGNALAIMIGVVGVLPRKKYYLMLYALLAPLYWALQSIATYKALWQLVTRPHYWEKTEHGISSYLPTKILKD
jgi:cellulose synthase/poly-beta-1,6-N-acetylglucosamine synthase-like glycosyltransferase